MAESEPSGASLGKNSLFFPEDFQTTSCHHTTSATKPPAPTEPVPTHAQWLEHTYADSLIHTQ